MKTVETVFRKPRSAFRQAEAWREWEGQSIFVVEFNRMSEKTENRSFEASLEALERIVKQLESGDLPLEKSLELFEQGIRLSRECQERLTQAERKIEVLLRDNQGRPVTAPFDKAGAASDNDDESVF